MTAALNVRNVDTCYGKSHILHGVCLEVNEGEIVTVLGRNGAGKTTLMRTLTGLTPPRAGVIETFGKNTAKWPAYRIAKLGIGYVPEGRKIFGGLTVLENLKVPYSRPGPWTLERVFTLFPRLGERRAQLAGQLSGGEQEMLAIARPLLLNPRLMLLDEPSQGLAPLIVKEVIQVVAQMRKEGVSVLLVEQNAALSLSISDRAYVLDDGRVVYSGPAAELARDTELVHHLAGASSKAKHPGRIAPTATP